jgi:hypothetical protein
MVISNNFADISSVADYIGVSRDALWLIVLHDNQFPHPKCTVHGLLYDLNEIDCWRFRWSPQDLSEFVLFWAGESTEPNLLTKADEIGQYSCPIQPNDKGEAEGDENDE